MLQGSKSCASSVYAEAALFQEVVAALRGSVLGLVELPALAGRADQQGQREGQEPGRMLCEAFEQQNAAASRKQLLPLLQGALAKL
eukprot:g65705.t1